MATRSKDVVLEKNGTSRFSSLEELCSDHLYILKRQQRGGFNEVPDGKYMVELVQTILDFEPPNVAFGGGIKMYVFYTLRNRKGRVKYFEDVFRSSEVRIASEIISMIRGRTVAIADNRFVDTWILELLRNSHKLIKEYVLPTSKT